MTKEELEHIRQIIRKTNDRLLWAQGCLDELTLLLPSIEARITHSPTVAKPRCSEAVGTAEGPK